MPILLFLVRGDESHNNRGPSPGLIRHVGAPYHVSAQGQETPSTAGPPPVLPSPDASSPRLDLRAAARHWGREDTSSISSRELSSRGAPGSTGNRTWTIVLSAAIPVGLLLVVGLIMICVRHRRRQFRSCFARGTTPIDDDEIATWRVSRDEKTALATSMGGPRQEEGRAGGEPQPAREAGQRENEDPISHGRQPSMSSLKKPPSLIVYTNIPPPQQQSAHHHHRSQSSCGSAFRPSGDGSPRSPRGGALISLSRKTSIDQDFLQTPVQARAPNARAGLTDEAIPGDDPFLPSPRRQPSRLFKVQPSHHHTRSSVLSSPRSIANVHHYNHSYHAHRRTRSSRSSMQSFAQGLRGSNSCEMLAGGPSAEWAAYSASECQLTLPESHDQAGLGGWFQQQQRQEEEQHHQHEHHHRQRRQPEPRSPPPVYSPTYAYTPGHTRLVSEPSIPPFSLFRGPLTAREPFAIRGFLPSSSTDEGEMLIGQAIG